MFKLASLAVAASLMLSGCATRTVEVPVEVKVPVAQPCPKATIRTAARPDELALNLITDATPMDKDVDYWKATHLQLVGYILGLETTVEDQASALAVCYGQ